MWMKYAKTLAVNVAAASLTLSITIQALALLYSALLLILNLLYGTPLLEALAESGLPLIQGTVLAIVLLAIFLTGFILYHNVLNKVTPPSLLTMLKEVW